MLKTTSDCWYVEETINKAVEKYLLLKKLSTMENYAAVEKKLPMILQLSIQK